MLFPYLGALPDQTETWKLAAADIQELSRKFDWRIQIGKLAALRDDQCANKCGVDHPCLEIEPRPCRLVWERCTFYFCGYELFMHLEIEGDMPKDVQLAEDFRAFYGNEAERLTQSLAAFISVTVKGRQNQISDSDFDAFFEACHRNVDEFEAHCVERGREFLSAPTWSEVSVSESVFPEFLSVDNGTKEELTRLSLERAGYTKRWPIKMLETRLLVLGSGNIDEVSLGTIGFNVWVLKQPITNEDTFRKGLAQ